ncbi:Uncharacterized protein Adt_03010 [Abeliophyllum distichum]|uniref:Uncharacterized protein n=1 Tax=Abeliophyllum distichum TaxID=126358 RepID=A0ABD1VXI7_9LAMI
MAFRAEAMIFVEVGIPYPKNLYFDEVVNEDPHRANLDLRKERHVDSKLRLAVYQKKMARYYNSKVWNRSFHVNFFVLKKVLLENREVGAGTLDPFGKDLIKSSRRSDLEPLG